MALWRAPVPLLGRSGYVALLGLVLAFATAGQPGSAAVGDTGPRFYVTPPTDSLPDNVPTAVTVVGRELAPRQALVVEECAVNPDGGRVCSKLAAAAARRDGTLRIVVHVTYVLPRRDLAPGSADQACDRRTRYEDCVLRVGDTTSGEELMAWPLWFAGHPGVCEASTGGDHYPNDAAARWSPDGSLLAFVRTQRGCAGTADVMVVRPDGSDLRRLGETNELWADLPATAWAPTGQQLAFGTPAGLTIVDMKTRRKQVVPGTSRAVTPVWSPDGGTIAYFRPDGVGVRQLHLVDVASGLDRLVDEPRADPAAAPAWSPDSKWLAYVAAVTDSRDVILLELAKGSTVNVGAPGAADSEPVWATDGSLLFVSDRSGKPALYAVSPGRDTVAVVLGAPTAPRDAAPSPRGGELAVTASLPERALWLVDEEGGNPRLAVRRGDVVGAPSWAPDGRRLAYAADAPCGRPASTSSTAPRVSDVSPTGASSVARRERTHCVAPPTRTGSGRSAVTIASLTPAAAIGSTPAPATTRSSPGTETSTRSSAARAMTVSSLTALTSSRRASESNGRDLSPCPCFPRGVTNPR